MLWSLPNYSSVALGRRIASSTHTQGNLVLPGTRSLVSAESAKGKPTREKVVHTSRSAEHFRQVRAYYAYNVISFQPKADCRRMLTSHKQNGIGLQRSTGHIIALALLLNDQANRPQQHFSVTVALASVTICFRLMLTRLSDLQ